MTGHSVYPDWKWRFSQTKIVEVYTFEPAKTIALDPVPFQEVSWVSKNISARMKPFHIDLYIDMSLWYENTQLSFGEASTSSTCSMAPSMSITAGAGRDASFATCHWQSGVGGWQVEMSKWKKIYLLNLRSLLKLWRFIQNHSTRR